jgi:copper/silver efflux system protein
VNLVRYPRELRDDVERLQRVLVATVPSARQVPLAQLADIGSSEGPSMIRNENGFLAGYVFVDLAGRDVGGLRAGGARGRRGRFACRPGYSLQWSGQYENMLRVESGCASVVPVTLFLIAAAALPEHAIGDKVGW